jgi:hypothetical protein
MKISLKGILEGTWNSIFIRKEIEQIAQDRNKICKGCSMNSDHQKKFNKYKTFRPDFHCVVCGCDLHLKTRALSQECPLGKWGAQKSQEEEFELTKKLEDEQSKT